jgi:hypothetical protein
MIVHSVDRTISKLILDFNNPVELMEIPSKKLNPSYNLDEIYHVNPGYVVGVAMCSYPVLR